MGKETLCRTIRSYWARIFNRQYSFSPTVLERVGLEHKCEANAGIFLPRRQTNMRKLLLGCQKSRKMFNVGNFGEITGLTDHYFK